MYPFYLGIDLHLKRTYVVLMDTEGEVIDERRLLNAEMAGYLEQHVPQETYAVMEAICFGNQAFLNENHKYQKAAIFIHFHAKQKALNRVEKWGVIQNYLTLKA